MEEVLSTELENVSRRLVPIWTTSCLSFFSPNVTRAAGDLRYGKCLQGQCWKTKQRKQKKAVCVPCGKFIRLLLFPRIPLPTKWEGSFKTGLVLGLGIPAIL